MKDLMIIGNHFHELEQAQFIMILIGVVVANIVPSALTAKGALIVNPIVNLIAGIECLKPQMRGRGVPLDNRKFAGL